MFNKELLLASQGVVDPKDFMKHSWFTVALKPAVTRASGSNIFELSFYTPLGLALDKYPFNRAGADAVYVPVEKFTNIPFDLSEMAGYEYSCFNEQINEDIYIKFEGLNSGAVTYNDVWISFNPGSVYVVEGDYFYYY